MTLQNTQYKNVCFILLHKWYGMPLAPTDKFSIQKIFFDDDEHNFGDFYILVFYSV